MQRKRFTSGESVGHAGREGGKPRGATISSHFYRYISFGPLPPPAPPFISILFRSLSLYSRRRHVTDRDWSDPRVASHHYHHHRHYHHHPMAEGRSRGHNARPGCRRRESRRRGNSRARPLSIIPPRTEDDNASPPRLNPRGDGGQGGREPLSSRGECLRIVGRRYAALRALRLHYRGIT